jgi:hypothetical protein
MFLPTFFCHDLDKIESRPFISLPKDYLSFRFSTNSSRLVPAEISLIIIVIQHSGRVIRTGS